MISIKQIKTADQEFYLFVERLLTNAFPQEEHRELDVQREFTDNNRLFHNNIILEEGSPIGLLSYWDFNNFVYIEHFAIDANIRNGGFGQKTLHAFKKKVQKPIVLEVELPEDEMSQRRIQFYQRQGFNLWEQTYQQPPYRKGDGNLPMYLMVEGKLDMANDFEQIKSMLYKEVYLVTE